MISNGQNSLNSPNPQLNIEKDYLYHFGLATGKNFSQRFQDVKASFIYRLSLSYFNEVYFGNCSKNYFVSFVQSYKVVLCI